LRIVLEYLVALGIAVELFLWQAFSACHKKAGTESPALGKRPNSFTFYNI